jgi:hypothetical protein
LMKCTNDGLKTVFVENRNQRRFYFDIHGAKLALNELERMQPFTKVFTFCTQNLRGKGISL